jgi:hypothetical protein
MGALLLQEPVPQEPAPQQPGTQEPEAQEQAPQEQQEKAATPEEIAEAIEKVRQSFADLDRSMLKVRDFAENQTIEPEAETEGVGGGFATAVEDADQLLNDMEELLAMLPSSDDSQQQSPSSGGGGGDSQQQGDPQQLDAQKPAPHPDDQDQQQSPEEGQNEDGENQNLKVHGIFMKPGQGGAWGHLPPRLQQTLENAQAEDLPLRYRNLLEQYYRKSK